MGTSCGKLRRGLIGLSPEETNYDRRQFRGATPGMRLRIEQVGATFLQGYHSALETADPPALQTLLASATSELRGFAYEGAAMALALLDWLTPWRRTRWAAFLNGPGNPHSYMAHVAVGWVWARVPANIERAQSKLDPLLGWLAFDGWGFHEGFFYWPKYISGQARPKRVTGYGARVFDQGLGRSFWFVNGGNAELIGKTLGDFASERQPDLWSGVGLAATYAGFADERSLQALVDWSGKCRAELAQGSAFAAKARQRAGNLTEYTERATQVLCGLGAEAAARLTDETLENLSLAGPQPAYETWRQRIQGHFRPGSKLQVAGARTYQ